MTQMRVNSWFNAKHAKFGNMGYAWAINPRIKFMMMITIVNNVGLNYTSSFSSGDHSISYMFIISNNTNFQEAGQATSSGFCGVTAGSSESESLSFPFTEPPS
jgi:hypothetical protein